MDQNTTNQPQEDQKPQGSYKKWFSRTKSYIILAAVVAIIVFNYHIATYFSHLTEEYNKSWKKDFPFYNFFTALSLFVIAISYIIYVQNKKRKKAFTKGYEQGRHDTKSKMENEFEAIKKSLQLSSDIKQIVEKVDKFKRKFIHEYKFSEDDFLQLIEVFGRHPETWLNFIENTIPKDSSYSSTELWKKLTVTLIKDHLIALQNFRTNKEF